MALTQFVFAPAQTRPGFLRRRTSGVKTEFGLKNRLLVTHPTVHKQSECRARAYWTFSFCRDGCRLCSRPNSHWRYNGECSRWKMTALFQRTISNSCREVSRLLYLRCEVDLAQRKHSGYLLASSGCQRATEFSNTLVPVQKMVIDSVVVNPRLDPSVFSKAGIPLPSSAK